MYLLFEKPSELILNLEWFSLAVRSEHIVPTDAVSFITPLQFEGRPIESLIHSVTFCSSSVADGEVSHIIHCAPIVDINISAKIEG